jgi:hypothetical protein
MQHWRTFFLHGTLFLLTVLNASASDSINLSLNPREAGAAISNQMLGLSYETSALLPDEKGRHYFRPDNTPLITMFKTLGIRSLRIGGNSVDSPKIAIPTEDDVSSLFEFAKAAGVKVIYSVRLENGDPGSAAKFAKLIGDKYASELDCFAIGNEPSYYRNYKVYRTKWKAIQDAMLAVYPTAKFCGPDQNPDPGFLKKLVPDLGTDGHFSMVTEHNYPFGCSFKNPKDKKDIAALVFQDSVPSCERMLAPAAYRTYEKVQKGMADAIAGTPLEFRLTETNSYWASGVKGASDRYASALWALDYLHWWAAHGAMGLNFHTGDFTGAEPSLPCRYAAFVSSGDGGYDARPLSYGIKMFDLGGYGKLIPVTVSSPEGLNIVAYASLADDHTLFVTVINKTQGVGIKDADMVLNVNSPSVVYQAEAILLRSTNSDLTAESGITVGEATLKKDGSWNGKWTPLEISTGARNVITTRMPPLSAMVLKLHLQ